MPEYTTINHETEFLNKEHFELVTQMHNEITKNGNAIIRLFSLLCGENELSTKFTSSNSGKSDFEALLMILLKYKEIKDDDRIQGQHKFCDFANSVNEYLTMNQS